MGKTNNEDKYDKYNVYTDDGTFVTTINSNLVKKQGIDDDTLEKIKFTHVLRHTVFDLAKSFVDDSQWSAVRQLATTMTTLEFYQQDLWGFPKDARFHRWFDFPGCLCPKMDNAERLGTSYQIIVSTCPIHSDQAFDEEQSKGEVPSVTLPPVTWNDRVNLCSGS